MLSSVFVNSITAWIPLKEAIFEKKIEIFEEALKTDIQGLYVYFYDCFMFATYPGVSCFLHI
jgi:hypothetical protein